MPPRMPTMSYVTFNPSCQGSTFNVTRLKRDSEFDVDFAGFNFHAPNHGPGGSPAIRRRKKMTRARMEGKHYNVPPRSVMHIINRAKHAVPLFIAFIVLAGASRASGASMPSARCRVHPQRPVADEDVGRTR